jgi:ABC-type uncharacterized transport system substrate-binding protein
VIFLLHRMSLVVADCVAKLQNCSVINFPPTRRTNRRSAICVPSIALPKSPVNSSSGDEVPHIFTRKSRLQPGEFLITSAKRLLAAMAATKTIPIVFTTGGDPVQEGYVASLNRPGSNVTGVSWFSNLVAGKGLGLLHELVPNAAVIALLVNPKLPETARMEGEGREAARSLGQQLLVLNASTPSEIDAAFATMRQQRAGALFVGADPFLSSRRQQIVALAARDAIPDMYTNREFVEEGGLMSYGNDAADSYRRAGVHVGRILNGASPADLPVDQATKFEFVINLKTAKTLGLEVPPGLSARADEVIE